MFDMAINPQEVADEVSVVSHAAAEKFFQEKLGGVDQYACGFAWVVVYPQFKGNTREGKAERRVLEKMGFRKSYTGGYQLWNPSKFPCQNVDTLEAGANAAADVLKSYGFKAYADSRLD